MLNSNTRYVFIASQIPRTQRHGLRYVGRRIYRVYIIDHVKSETHEKTSTETIIQFQWIRAI